MLISEELHLLLTEANGKAPWYVGSTRRFGENAALVVDLILAGRVATNGLKLPKIHVISYERTGNPVLDGGLEKLRKYDGKALSRVVQSQLIGARHLIIDSLADQGVLERGEPGMFGTAGAAPERDPMPERMLRQRLASVLDGTAQPTPSDTALLSTLNAMNLAAQILKEESGGMSRGKLRKRIRELVDRMPTSDAVEAAVQQISVILMTVLLVPFVVGGGAS